MKKQSSKQQIRVVARLQRRERKARRKHYLARIRDLEKTQLSAVVEAYRQRFQAQFNVVPPLQSERVPIMVPENFSLRENYNETVATLETIRDLVLSRRQPVFLYFDKLKNLEPAAALLLVAEVFRCRQLRIWRNGSSVNGNYPSDDAVFFQMREMGFFSVLGLRSVDEVMDNRPQGERPYYVRFLTMNSVHPELAADFCDLVIHGAFEMSQLAKNRMVAALKEAMGNAHEHAYVGQGEYQFMPRRWWLAGYVNPVHKEMMVLILDQGVGIPRTLPATVFEILSAILHRTWVPSDGNMIAAATELHRTSTDQRGRGRGFQDMKRFVDTCDDGELRVCSNGGSYTYMKGGQDTIEDFSSSIGGTLIQWRVRHQGQLVEITDE